MAYIQINGIIETNDNVDDFTNKLIDWIESQDCFFTGGLQLVDEEGEHIDE